MDLFIDKKHVDIFKKSPFDNDNKYTTETLVTHKSSKLSKIFTREDIIKTW